jgi:hypothetical protein
VTLITSFLQKITYLKIFLLYFQKYITGIFMVHEGRRKATEKNHILAALAVGKNAFHKQQKDRLGSFLPLAVLLSKPRHYLTSTHPFLMAVTTAWGLSFAFIFCKMLLTWFRARRKTGFLWISKCNPKGYGNSHSPSLIRALHRKVKSILGKCTLFSVQVYRQMTNEYDDVSLKEKECIIQCI